MLSRTGNNDEKKMTKTAIRVFRSTADQTRGLQQKVDVAERQRIRKSKKNKNRYVCVRVCVSVVEKEQKERRMTKGKEGE